MRMYILHIVSISVGVSEIDARQRTKKYPRDFFIFTHKSDDEYVYTY